MAEQSTRTLLLDDIVEELDVTQIAQLAELWTMLDILTTLPDFEDSTLGSAASKKHGNAHVQATKFDLSVLKTKAVKKALGNNTPEKLHDALLRNVKHEDPDTLLVRFLRARKWKLEDALSMLLSTLRWRHEEGIEDMIAKGDYGYAQAAEKSTGDEAQIAKEVLAQFASGQSFLHKVDKNGCPLEYIRVCLHDPRAQSRRGFEVATILDAETVRMALRAPRTTMSMVFDLTGFSMANMDMNALKIMASGLTDNYPECLGSVYVYNAPWIINGIWALIRGWLDPVVQTKVHFCSNIDQLSQHIPIKDIPKYMGGEDDWEFKWLEPKPPAVLTASETQLKTELQTKRAELLSVYEQTTRDWLQCQDDDDEGSKLLTKRRDLVVQLKENYWQLDPFVRGQTILDREGILGPQGELNFVRDISDDGSTELRVDVAIEQSP